MLKVHRVPVNTRWTTIVSDRLRNSLSDQRFLNSHRTCKKLLKTRFRTLSPKQLCFETPIFFLVYEDFFIRPS